MSKKTKRKMAALALSLMGFTTLVCAISHLRVQTAGEGKCFDKTNPPPARRTAMVLGCPKFTPGGIPLHEYAERVKSAAKLFHSGGCERILVSSDLDAPLMLADLVSAGVPRERMDCDTLGKRTRDSVLRAKFVYGLEEGILVSQRYHNERALFIGEEIGTHWIAYDAADASGRQWLRSFFRETLARVKAVFERYVFATSGT